ncbi:hypothetical protein PoMZ_02519 [Pyricularia oryzae]|uniref:Uncharacterized protein n=1 Tax=Pyricularia oryzae TaxID=318829 RepID=A0A4P7N4Z5_PYROR|nr:hypothetical protein PoMZ_02519 [Pyricularia oryzae]
MWLALIGKRNALRVALNEFRDFERLNKYLGHFANLPQKVGAGVKYTSREQMACNSTPSAVASVIENSRPLKRRRSEPFEESEHPTVIPDNTGIFTQVTLTTASPNRAQNSFGNAATAYVWICVYLKFQNPTKYSGIICPTTKAAKNIRKRKAPEKSPVDRISKRSGPKFAH